MTTRLVLGVPRSLLGLVLVSMLLVKVGLNKIDNFDVAVVALTNSPLSYPLAGDARASYLMGNWLGPALMNLLGVTGEQNLFIIYSFFTIAFVAAVLVFPFRSLPDREARIASLLFIIFPVTAAPFHWVGYDSLALLLIALILLARNPLTVLLLSVLAGVQHGEMIVVGSLLALVANHFSFEGESKWLDQRKLFVIMMGGLLGRGVLEIIFRMNGLVVSSRIAEAMDNFDETVGMWGRTIPVITISMMSIAWAVLIVGWRTNVIPKTGTVISLATGLLLTIVLLDQTRVAAISTFLVVTVVILLNRRLLNAVSPSAALVLLGIWWLTPGLWVWEGRIQTYGSFSFVRNALFGQ